ncbi:MAG: M23 family metallopeptidase [Calditrichaeota bacterium]|nr:MAG: M23 family peptidase [Calditrichota bacterium]MBL1206693.1 M23 family metallopeptidase [Calditrichota bacterium]NOG46520.1 M23 family metallopeptidase [Calditrichota bacterium]
MSRSKRKIKTYSFLIIPDSKDNPKNFTLSAFAVRSLLISAVVVLVLIVLGAASYWSVANIALDYVRLKEENFELRTSLQSVEGMQSDLSKMRKMNDDIRNTLTGYVQIEKVSAEDDTSLTDLDFDNLKPEKKRTIFNFIPSIMPVNGFITRGYQVKDLVVDPHYGLDIAASKGTAIKATADGTVIFSGWTLKSGYILIIKHKYGYTSLYKHNQRNLVSILEKVTKGQVIALVGDTGEISSGAHVHFEVWNNDQPIDPMMYVSALERNKN